MDPDRRTSLYPAGLPRLEKVWVASLCLVAAVHVFFYSAAFPFFNNLNERAQFDTVVKYSHGQIPRRLDIFSPETLRDTALYDSKFYFNTNRTSESMPPPWMWPIKEQIAWVAVKASPFPATNYEASQPPAYYTYAAMEWRLGAKLRLSEGSRLYGLRFMNIPIAMLLVWLGWLAACHVFPEQPFRRLAVPAFLACLPQSAFYSIQNDVLSPVCYGLAFLGLLYYWHANIPTVRLGVITGLALAAACLTKITNLLPVLAFLLVLAVRAWRYRQVGKLAAALPSFSVFAVCAGLPALAWMTWCKIQFGDFTGSRPRAEYWGWTLKPFADWWHHPIFTPSGLLDFLNHLISSFWQGELICHQQPMTFPLADWTYTAITLVFLLAPLIKMTFHPATVSRVQSRVFWVSLFLVLSAVSFLVLASVACDFHNSPHPSRESPYLWSGRLILAVLIPFMLLFVSGLDILLKRSSLRAKYVILAILLLAMAVVEALNNSPAFANPYNWFHLA